MPPPTLDYLRPGKKPAKPISNIATLLWGLLLGFILGYALPVIIIKLMAPSDPQFTNHRSGILLAVCIVGIGCLISCFFTARRRPLLTGLLAGAGLVMSGLGCFLYLLSGQHS